MGSLADEADEERDHEDTERNVKQKDEKMEVWGRCNPSVCLSSLSAITRSPQRPLASDLLDWIPRGGR